MSEKRGLDNGVQHPEEDSTNVSSSEIVKKQKTDIDNDLKKSDESPDAKVAEASPTKTGDGDSKTAEDCSKDSEGVSAVSKNSAKPAVTNPEMPQEAKVKHEILSANALVIFGLHPLVKKEEMKEVLDKFGEVERLEMKKAFASTYCFCDYKTNEEAKTAIEKLNGTELKGKPLIVKLANDKNDRSKPFSGK
mmetsp:Transcript_27857/g.41112  ORF Transcript_27857/g.41112 Transcript_27857/m.41112 type:complete len:192 (+) Transcript_27857:56-631(+)|eukprot:CAMPEP_0194200298 /NCGR_PEP_ID=MMETSP0156-20130528/962_1 /TAXON_ID=33649 /ORGANISM="Thalassionema nitzschioides, Strain L26-B" /LENGTH=191 /DNA_ID=CAMNT_0038925273 /DNA_START=55 /DNA_END=630 /DNA_ORIENTATION=-